MNNMEERNIYEEVKLKVTTGQEVSDGDLEKFFQQVNKFDNLRLQTMRKEAKEVTKELKKDIIHDKLTKARHTDYLVFATKYLNELGTENYNNYKLLADFSEFSSYLPSSQDALAYVMFADYCGGFNYFYDSMTSKVFDREDNVSLMGSIIDNQEAVEAYRNNHQGIMDYIDEHTDPFAKKKVK